MLKILVPKVEFFDDNTNEFVNYPEVELELEHSLVSLSKWESKWEIPFLSDKPKTDEQTIDYIKSMVISPDVPDDVFSRLSNENIDEIGKYINAKMTATWFSEDTNKKTSSEIVTAEVIYYWMISLQVPIEFQHWHLNKLMTLIQVCNRKNQPEKKMNQSDVIARNRALNEARKAQFKTKG